MMSLVQEVFSRAVDDLRRTWPQLLATDVVYKTVAFTILSPLVGLALRLFVSTSGSSVLADQDILVFVLSPIGLLALGVVGAVGLGIIVLEQACLMAIGMAATRNARVGTSEALRYGARRAGSVLQITSRVVTRVLLIAAPFVVAGGLVYLTLLTTFDINYYLTERPRAFWIAVTVMGALFVVPAGVLIRHLIGWVFALPLHLFEDVRAADALKTSAERTKGHSRTIALVMVGWAAVMTLLESLALGAIGFLGQLVLPSLTRAVGLLVVTMGVLFLLWVGASLLVSLAAASTFALLIVRLYDRLGRSEEARLGWSEDSDPLGVRKRWSISLERVLGALFVVAIVAGLVGDFLVDSVRLDDDVLVFAHRGAAGAAPENTLASFERAISDGADYVELDVQETADGEVVVIHDSDLMKISGVDLKIWDATFEQLQSIDVGSWFSPEFKRERVPKLEQVLEICEGRIRVNIELKTYGRGQRLEERVVEIVERAGMESQVVVMSLDYPAIQKVRKLRPDWTIGVLTARAVGDLTRLDADFLAVHTGLASLGFVRAAHKSGKKVYAWTVNDPIQMFGIIGKGVDGLITDEPALAKAVLEKRALMNPVERLLLTLSSWSGVGTKQPEFETDGG